MKTIETPGIPKANGHYSPCIEHNGLLYLSGQLPKDPVTGLIPKTIEEQTDQVLKNVENIVNEGGSAKNQILQMRVYISDIELWDAVNVRYSTFFGDHKPVRTIVPTRDLHFGCLIEIEAIAVVLVPVLT